jgi:hypothetical protein
MHRLLGGLLLIVGLVLIWSSYNESQAFADRMKHFFTGDFRDQTTLMFLGGAASAIVGLLLFTGRSHRRLGFGGGSE